ncbi:MAG: glycerophosphodiester phosphodiesterase [Chloroflexota bacterium]|nr:glycerophosphodiester phosphodiesterase [Chloroflexota bacterium]
MFTTRISPQDRNALCIAHRGASAYATENSPEALQIAAQMGADMVEVDVRVTADEVPVISHDDSLARVYGIDLLVAQHTLADIHAHVPLLTFEQVLEQCETLGLGLYLDIKALTPLAMQRMFAAIDARSAAHALVFASFNPDTLTMVKAARPDMQTAILFGGVDVEPVALAQACQADYVHPCWERVSDRPDALLTDDWLGAVREAGLGVVTWHEERPPVIAALKRLGVTGICTDQPDLVVSAG